MNKQYIKKAVSPEISAEGGAVAVFVNKETIPLETSIKEALDGNYTMGQEPLIKNLFMGLMQSMIAGLLRDGQARTIGGLITVYLVVKGEFDLEKGWDPEVNSLQVRARLLNDLDIDISRWVFEDVTPGKRAFTLTTARAGATVGKWSPHKPGMINGNKLPSTQAGEDLRIDWEVLGTDKKGTLPAAKVTSDVTRIDVKNDAFAEIDSAEYDGKTLKFTVRGNFSNAVKEVVLDCTPAPVVRIDEAYGSLNEEQNAVNGELLGENLQLLPGDEITYAVTVGDMTYRGNCTINAEESDSEKIAFTIADEVTAEWAGKTVTLKLYSHAGIAEDPEQVVETSLEIEG